MGGAAPGHHPLYTPATLARAPGLVIEPERLQRDYEARRKAARAAFEELRAGGVFRAPDHLAPGLQAELGLGLVGPLPLDHVRAEAG